MLLADPVEEFAEVILLDTGAFLVGCLFGELAERAGDGGAIAECWAAEGLFARSIATFLGMEFEGSRPAIRGRYISLSTKPVSVSFVAVLSS
jgi:hypothetical protein